jgi:hypothetical protein
MELKLGSEWAIPSNSGRSMVSASLKRVHDTAEERLLLFDVRCRRESFSQYCEGELVADYDILLHQVALSKRDVSQNVALLTDWLQTPRELELAFSARHQTFIVSLRKQEGVYSSVEKPVCSVSCQSFLLKCQIGFVVDQTCIRILRDSLSAFSASYEQE